MDRQSFWNSQYRSRRAVKSVRKRRCLRGCCCGCCRGCFRGLGNGCYEFFRSRLTWLWLGCVIVFYGSLYLLLEKWSDVSQLHSFPQCASRVGDNQSELFRQDVYLLQFNSTAWYLSDIANNETLCGQGFVGNSDIYGLGVRLGIYLQWLSCLLANHTLPDTRSALAQAYMIFLIAICAAIVVMSVQSTCTFAIEIVILYYMFFGGFFCAFSHGQT